MIIAIPIAQGSFSQHFGHCETFRLFHTDKEKNIIKVKDKTPPPHEPGVFPKWLSEEKADVIITGGMGMHAKQLFASYGIEVISGASSGDPETIVKNWLNGTLISGGNICDH
ncbi:MAG: NifB/NifX family molybdenum-iron cluster-binding protein [Candidatus Marinimicrobia bacterium]|nr:NifB/NifX family molybdenum-iron cluster-binding protein [Candidatus Neomarinimicrobiota bacterium]